MSPRARYGVAESGPTRVTTPSSQPGVVTKGRGSRGALAEPMRLGRQGLERRAAHRVGQCGIRVQEFARAVATLTDALSREREVRAALFEHSASVGGLHEVFGAGAAGIATRSAR